MFERLTKIATAYFGASRSQQMRELYLSTSILDFAATSVLIFEPIYLSSIGFSIQRIILFYLAIYILFFLLMPFGGKLVRSRGYEHGIMYSTPFYIMYFLSLFAIPYSPIFIVTAVVSYAIQKTCYWPGYHADFARFGEDHQTGRDISVLMLFVTGAAVLGPAVGGFIVSAFGFPALFVFVSVLILLSNVPLLLTPEVFTPRPFLYMDSLRRLVKKENRRQLFAFMGFGEEFIVLALWPLFLLSVAGETFGVGAIVSLSTLATVLATVVVGKLTDSKARRTVLRLGVLYTALSWLMRAVVAGPVGVFFSDALYRSSRAAVGIPLMATTYDHARKYSVTKTAVFLEGAVVLGKIAAAVVSLAVVTFFPEYSWTILFIVAALFTVLYARFEPEATPAS